MPESDSPHSFHPDDNEQETLATASSPRPDSAIERWITRCVAALCAAGSTALFWTFGMFVAVPWRENRLLALSAVELQVVGIPIAAGLVVGWGALHILAMSDGSRPRLYRALCVALLIVAVIAVLRGVAWSTARIP